MTKRPGTFVVTTVVLWLLAHAVGYFCHEFAHTFSALALGWKSNPFDLDWGTTSPMNLLLQQEIDENVNYDPIFGSGHGMQAGVIALAGSALGNLIVSLAAGVVLMGLARRRGARLLGYFAYWLIVMSVGNLISYVPLRVFASHADMHTVALGFGWTPLEVLLYVGIPFFAAVIWFFAKLQPAALAWLFPERVGYRYAVVVLTSLTVFGFFCLGGLSGYGEVSRQVSIAFMAVGGPLSLILGVMRSRQPA